MCRPRLPNTLRQRLASAPVAARSQIGQEPVRLQRQDANCSRRSAGTISRASSRMRARRRRSPRRPSTATSAITASTRWRRSRRSGRSDNRGVMIRVLGEPGDPSTHLENRVGEPLANPYLYMASQIHAGLDGIARKLKPGPSADSPYEISAEPLPKSLAEALAALKDSACFRAGFGDVFVDYLPAHQARRDRALRRGVERAVRRRDRCHGLGAQGVFRSGLMRAEGRCASLDASAAPRKQAPKAVPF